MTSDSSLFFRIIDGPSKFDLMLSLFDRNKETRRIVEFGLAHVRSPITVAISMIAQEYGSCETWCFDGHASCPGAYKVQGYFCTDNQEGLLEFKVVLPKDRQALEQYVQSLRIAAV